MTYIKNNLAIFVKVNINHNTTVENNIVYNTIKQTVSESFWNENHNGFTLDLLTFLLKITRLWLSNLIPINVENHL